MKLYLYKFENFFLPQLQLSSMSKLFMVYCKYAHKKNLPCAPPNPTNTPACPAAFRRMDKICIYWVNVCLWFWNCCNQSHSNACIESVFFLDNKQILKENKIKSFFKLVGFHWSLLLIGNRLFKCKGIMCFWQNQRVHFIPLQQCSGCLSSCRAARPHRRLPLY